MAAATPIPPRNPNMPWIAAFAALVLLWLAGWLPTFSAVIGILGFVAVYVMIRRATLDDTKAMTLFFVAVGLFVVLPLVWVKYTATQDAAKRRQVVSDVLNAQRINTPGSVGIGAYHDYCLLVEDTAGWYMENRLTNLGEDLKKVVRQTNGPSQTPSPVADSVTDNFSKANETLTTLVAVQKAAEECRKNIIRFTGKELTPTKDWSLGISGAPTSLAGWWLLGFPFLVIGYSLYRGTAPLRMGSVIGGLMLVTLFTVLGYALLTNLDSLSLGKFNLKIPSITFPRIPPIEPWEWITWIVLLVGPAMLLFKAGSKALSAVGWLLITAMLGVLALGLVKKIEATTAAAGPRWTYCGTVCTEDVRADIEDHRIHIVASGMRDVNGRSFNSVLEWRPDCGKWYYQHQPNVGGRLCIESRTPTKIVFRGQDWQNPNTWVTTILEVKK
jgi:hypothetical protein